MSEVCFGRSVAFEAAHHYAVPGWDAARNREVFGDAADPHVHAWTLTVWLSGPLDPVTGMMVDLARVDAQLQAHVVAPFHGKSFRAGDAFFETHQPTTEVLAGYFAERLQNALPETRLVRLRIAEAPDLFAEWCA